MSSGLPPRPPGLPDPGAAGSEGAPGRPGAASSRNEARGPDPGRVPWLLVPWLAILGAVLASVRLGVPEHVALLLPVLVLAGLAWLGAWRWLARRPDPGRGALAAILAGALLLRLAALAGDPRLSDDVHRYVWEGGLVLTGKSPYAAAPDAPERAAERARWPEVHARLNHPSVSAAYPPLTQLASAAVVGLAGGPAAEGGRAAARALRLFAGLCELAVLVPLLLLAEPGRRAAVALGWGWCPLLALEFAGGAHGDALGVLALVAGILAFEPAPRGRGRRALGLALLGAGALVKLLPLGLVPVALRRCRRPWRAALALSLGLVLAFLPLVLASGGTQGLGRGLGEYGLRWESTSLVFRWVQPLFEPLGERDGSWRDPRRLARGAVLLAWLAVVAWHAVRRSSLVRAGHWVMGAFVLLTPTLHPWYLAWVLPFAVLERSLAWGLFVALAPLLYWPLGRWVAQAEWVEPGWLWPAVALPFLALLLAELRRGRGGPGREPAPRGEP